MKTSNPLEPQDLVDQIVQQDADRTAAVRCKAQKDSRIRKWYDKLLFKFYGYMVDWVAWNQKKLQSLVNLRNKYSETYLVHDSHRVFAEMMQGSQLNVLKELSIVGASKIDDAKLLLTFSEITKDDDGKFFIGEEGMLVIVEAVNDGGVPFLKVGMDTWEKHDDSARNN